MIVSSDIVDRSMAGPGIRAWEFASALAGQRRVTLAIPNGADLDRDASCVLQPRSRRQMSALIRASDVVLCQGPRLMPVLLSLIHNREIVVDLYHPYNIELLEAWRPGSPRFRQARQRRGDEVLKLQLLAGDFFLCASERQRDYWLGALSARGRLDPATYDRDPTLRSLIDVAPFGLPKSPPRRDKGAIKGMLPGVGRDDFVLLWGGGLWDWLDPLTPIRAMAIVRRARPDVKLVFLGTRHPNPEIGRPAMVDRAVALAGELGLLGSTVMFNEGWVPYEERDRYLADADLGISAHHEHLETRFAFRTRLLDYLWAQLPVVCTRGDDLGDTVERAGLGIAVGPGDVEGMAEAIRRLREDSDLRGECRRRLGELTPRFTWDQVVGPLARYCEQPRQSARRSPQQRAMLVAGILRFYVSLALDRRWRG